jgi:hypothetical protein
VVVDRRKHPDFYEFVDWLCQAADKKTLTRLVHRAEQTRAQLDRAGVEPGGETWRLKNSLEAFINLVQE